VCVGAGWGGEVGRVMGSHYNTSCAVCVDTGWGGGGLGTAEQGIVDPVARADIRDRQDMFKGIGIQMNDPFEQFRKNKSHGFTVRMKKKAELALEKAAAASKTPPPSPPPPPHVQ